MKFKEVSAEELQINPFMKIKTEWMLITAGTMEKCNTMTASWGGMGALWNKNTVTTYIRPQRYTKEFIDANDTFTIAFFPETYKEALNICGTISGRDCDKIAKAGLTPMPIEQTVAFEEASMILVCKKMYQAEMPPENFIAKENDAKWYPDKDYHIMYISEIQKVLVKEE